MRAAAAPPLSAAAGFLDPSTHRVAYDALRAGRAEGIDPSIKEQYLSDEEFEVVMKVPRDQFASLKPWKRQQLKRNAGLF
eukprot:Transcript_15017.p3 GENE.Transcript_15017~~Transcript_15017.p3  ORF type:complete len:80 (-),score=35.26 Transcript_15017:207-446(-)